MKKNYFMVLIALLAFALNANAQDATGQNETNNRMTVKMNDGTSFILNTDNVAEITFGDGEPAFSGQNIIKALEALDELGQYVYKFDELEGNDDELMDYVNQLTAIENDTRCRVDKNQNDIQMLNCETANLKACIDDLKDRSNDQVGRITLLEALISEQQAINNEQQKRIAEQQNINADQQDMIIDQQNQIQYLETFVDALASSLQALKAQVDAMQQ